MAEYAELVNALRCCAKLNSLSHYKRDLMKQAAETIERLSADVRENVHGHWVMEEYDYPCSVCGETIDYEYDIRNLRYCPNCGADMRGVGDEHTD